MAAETGVSRALVAFSIVLLLSPLAAPQDEPAGTANIPFEFFVADERLPEGEYSVTFMPGGIVNFCNKKTTAAAQTFTGRFGDGVEAKDARLVFVRYKDQYRFVGLRGISGTWRVTVNYFTAMPDGATRHEIPISYAERN